MKRVTASEARKNWFRLLDEVAEGETVEIDRRGARIVLCRKSAGESSADDIPDYRELIVARDVESADEWGWEWSGPEGEVALREGTTP